MVHRLGTGTSHRKTLSLYYKVLYNHFSIFGFRAPYPFFLFFHLRNFATLARHTREHKLRTRPNDLDQHWRGKAEYGFAYYCVCNTRRQLEHCQTIE